MTRQKTYPGVEVVYFAVPRVLTDDDGEVCGGQSGGLEHPADSFGVARRILDQLHFPGIVERWTRHDARRVLVARRTAGGEWQERCRQPGQPAWRPLRPGDVPDFDAVYGHARATATAPAAGEVPAEVLRAAGVQGHTVVPDLTAIGPVDRWTCTGCPATVLRRDGQVYGNATTQACDRQLRKQA